MSYYTILYYIVIYYAVHETMLYHTTLKFCRTNMCLVGRALGVLGSAFRMASPAEEFQFVSNAAGCHEL